MDLMQLISLSLNALSLIAIMIGAFKFIKDADNNADTQIKLIQQSCRLKHDGIDKDIKAIKENHLTHIEEDLAHLKQEMTKISYILEQIRNNKNK